MYREILIPTDTKLTIELPSEWVGKPIEVLAFAIELNQPEMAQSPEAFEFWKQHSIDLSGFRFNRDDANER
ncbi:MAG: hypothetical protein H7Z75_16865 [Ferruginibacter sp.]|nr:hypothetical protein [Cytophagales bacterium]